MILTNLPAILPCVGFCLKSTEGMSVSRRNIFTSAGDISPCNSDGNNSLENPSLGLAAAMISFPVLK